MNLLITATCCAEPNTPSLITSKELRPLYVANAFHSSITIPVAPIIFHSFPHAQSRPQNWNCFISIESTFISPLHFSTPLQIFAGHNQDVTHKSGKISSLLWSLVSKTWKLKMPCPSFLTHFPLAV